MITRYAFFEGSIRAGEEAAFREAVLQELVPTWRAFPGILAVRVSFPQARDDGAPEMALIAEQKALVEPPDLIGFALTNIDLRRRAHG